MKLRAGPGLGTAISPRGALSTDGAGGLYMVLGAAGPGRRRPAARLLTPYAKVEESFNLQATPFLLILAVLGSIRFGITDGFPGWLRRHPAGRRRQLSAATPAGQGARAGGHASREHQDCACSAARCRPSVAGWPPDWRVPTRRADASGEGCRPGVRHPDRHAAILRSTVLRDSLKIAALVFMILIGACFSLVFRGLERRQAVAKRATACRVRDFSALLLVMALMFLLGFFLDFIEIIFVVVPIVGPVLLQMDISPIWLGVFSSPSTCGWLSDAALRLRALLPARGRPGRGSTPETSSAGSRTLRRHPVARPRRARRRSGFVVTWTAGRTVLRRFRLHGFFFGALLPSIRPCRGEG